MPHVASTAGLGGRATRWVVATTAVGAVLALALGSPAAGVAVLVTGASAAAVAWRGWLREVDALDRLSLALDAELAGRAPLDPDLPGEAGRVARQLAGVLHRAREAEDAGRAAMERTTEMLDAAPSGVVVVRADGTLEHVNEALRQMLELTDDPVGLLPLEGLHALELSEAIEEALRGRTSRPRDLVAGERDLVITAHPMGEGALALARDVTHERLVERARTDFVANVSHELRTPVAAILGFSETLLDTPDLAVDVAPMARAIHRNALRLRQLFEDLLTLHRIEARRRELPREHVSLAPLLADAVVTSADAAAHKGLTFELDVPDQLAVWANPQALAAIVGNLAGNACKYTERGGHVVVRAVKEEDGIRVDVVDTGLGIPRAHQGRVFERFYRVDEGRARDIGGTGLGLAIAKHLAEATGCRITLQSEEGRGSTFSVHVPRAARSKVARTWDATLDSG